MPPRKGKLLYFLLYWFFSIGVGKTFGSNREPLDIEVSLENLLSKSANADLQNDDASSAVKSISYPGSIAVAAFNVQVFGRKKMSKQRVAEKLTKIILRYDLILIQEIRDSSGASIRQLLTDVNAKSASITYSMVISERLGRSSSKEQYAFIYRSDIFQVATQYVYDDSSQDVFQREPLVVKFTSSIAAISSFIAIGIHTAPSDAASEISHLVDVYDDAVLKLGTTNAIIMGDFNAGCTYINDWSKIRLASDRRFYWLTNDMLDTTSKSTECAYDRFVAAGVQMLDAIEPLGTGVFQFDKAYGLTYDQATDISDHYPIQMRIRTKKFNDRISQKRLIKIVDKGILSRVPIPPSGVSGMVVIKQFKAAGDLESFDVKCSLTGVRDSGEKIDELKTAMGEFISATQVEAAKRHMDELSMVKFLPKNNRYYQTLHDYYKTVPFLYEIKAHCPISQKRCVLSLEVEDAI